MYVYIYIYYILTATIHWVDSNNVSKMNSLWPGDAIWRHVTMSTLDQVMDCCLTAPSHYLNQCWLIMGGAPWHSYQDIILIRCEDTNQQNKIENCNFKWHPGHNELTINEIVRQRFIAVTSISKNNNNNLRFFICMLLCSLMYGAYGKYISTFSASSTQGISPIDMPRFTGDPWGWSTRCGFVALRISGNVIHQRWVAANLLQGRVTSRLDPERRSCTAMHEKVTKL